MAWGRGDRSGFENVGDGEHNRHRTKNPTNDKLRDVYVIEKATMLSVRYSAGWDEVGEGEVMAVSCTRCGRDYFPAPVSRFFFFFLVSSTLSVRFLIEIFVD